MSEQPTVIIDGVVYVPDPQNSAAPAPVPVAQWVVWTRDGAPTNDEAESAADALNALDRDGVAWGEPRPPETLPAGGRVLVAWGNGSVGIVYADELREREREWTGWWPLPEGSP